MEKPLTRDQIKRIKERMLRAESKESVLADLNEKKKETARVPKKQGPAKEKAVTDMISESLESVCREATSRVIRQRIKRLQKS